MTDFRADRYTAVVSSVFSKEIGEAPDFFRHLYDEIQSWPAEVIEVDEESLSLLNEYKDRSILSEKHLEDMLHIALATIAEVDVLVSWNFKHIVLLDKIRFFNAVTMEQGYKPLNIFSPLEVISHEYD